MQLIVAGAQLPLPWGLHNTPLSFVPPPPTTNSSGIWEMQGTIGWTLKAKNHHSNNTSATAGLAALYCGPCSLDSMHGCMQLP